MKNLKLTQVLARIKVDDPPHSEVQIDKTLPERPVTDFYNFGGDIQFPPFTVSPLVGAAEYLGDDCNFRSGRIDRGNGESGRVLLGADRAHVH